MDGREVSRGTDIMAIRCAICIGSQSNIVMSAIAYEQARRTAKAVAAIEPSRSRGRRSFPPGARGEVMPARSLWHHASIEIGSGSRGASSTMASSNSSAILFSRGSD